MAGKTMKLKRPKSLTELVVAELRTRIIDGRLQLGEALSENALAAELGISKTPVREALLQLRLERLVEIHPQRGTFVFRLSAEQVVLICELRDILETAAAERAIARNRALLRERMGGIFEAMRTAYEAGDIARYRATDGEYHQTLVDLAGNAYIVDAYNQVGFFMQALRSRLSTEAALNRRSFKDHRDMLRMIRAGDIDALKALLVEHIAQTRESYLRVLAAQDEEAKAAS